MKNFSVNVHYDYCAIVDVVAENERDAIEKAKNIANAMPLEELEYCDFIDACVTDVID